MSEQSATPAEVFAELDDIIAEDEAASNVELTASNKGFNATPQAMAYANDHGIDLKGVKGTGADGKVTVPNVEKIYKQLQVEAEAKAEAEAEAKAEAEVEVEEIATVDPSTKPETKKAEKKPKTKKVSRKGTVATSPLLPTLRQGLIEVMHIKRTINQFSTGAWEEVDIVSGKQADEKLSEYLNEGWHIIHLQSLGVITDGIQFMWIMGKAVGGDQKDWPYRDIIHMVQNVGSVGPDGRGLTGFQADAWVNSYLDDGWELAYVEAITMSTAGINMMWVMVR